MCEFSLKHTSDDGVITTVEFDVECWPDSFPYYLNMLRGAGYVISRDTSLLVNKELCKLAKDREFMVLNDDPEQHSIHYYDIARNK